MDNILLCSGYLPATTYIHNTFIENYMLSANGSYVKVYIYLSKCIQAGEKNLSISSLADKMDNTEKDILRALNYWEKKGLIHLVKDKNSGGITEIEILNPDSKENPLPVKSTSKTTKNTEYNKSGIKPVQAMTDTIMAPDNNSISNEEQPAKETITAGITGTTTAAIPAEETVTAATKETTDNTSSGKNADITVTTAQTERLAGDEDFIWTTRVIESYVNRPLKTGEIQLISYLYDNLGFSPELLLYLYEYCISRGKTNVNYIKAVALSWDEQNIKSPDDAKKIASDYKATYTAISKAFALDRPIATAEKQFISRWLDEWHMDLAVVLDACNRTILKLQKADFRYTDGTLEKWHNKNIHTLQDVSKEDEEYAKKKKYTAKKQHSNITYSNQDKNQFNRFLQREISPEEIDELERRLLAR